MTQAESITLNGTTHALADLSAAAREQVDNVKLVDAEIIRLQRQLAIAKTARSAYASALVAAVGTTPAATPDTPAK